MEFEVNVNKPVDTLLFATETNCALFNRDNKFFVTGADSQENAQALVDAHNPPPFQEPTVADKLASVGLNLDDLKAALGL